MLISSMTLFLPSLVFEQGLVEVEDLDDEKQNWFSGEYSSLELSKI